MKLINHKKNLTFNQLLAGVILAAFTFEGVSMSFFSKTEEEVVLFSEMEGYITFKGNPVSNVKVERWIKWKDEIGEKDSVVTDSKGFFRLPIKKGMVKSSGVSQFVVAQEIRVYYQSKEYPIWAKAKREKQEYSELNGKPVNFRCELSDELIVVDSGRGTLMTSCKWDALK